MNIAVLAGGYSPERDVSLTSGSLIANALIDEGHSVCLCDVYLGIEINGKDVMSFFGNRKNEIYRVKNDVPDLEALKAKSGNGNALVGEGVVELCRAADVVFLALHGSIGENGQLQAMFDNYGIRYTGSGYTGSLLAMDKDISKKLFSLSGIKTPEWMYCKACDCNIDEILNTIGLPCVIKPCSCGSSVGISIVENKNELEMALEYAGKYEDYIIAEKKINGRELTVGILDKEVLPMIEIIPNDGFYDYKNKYQAGKTLEICPAQLSRECMERLSLYSKTAFEVLRLEGYARFDFIVDEQGECWCLEANTLPGMTPTSLLPQMAAQSGISYGKLCGKIVETALKT